MFDEDGTPCTARRASWSARRRSRRCRSGSGTIPTARKYPRRTSRLPRPLAPRRLRRAHRARGLIIYGRSDAVLNPGGVRIGTAEIYRQVEQLDEIVESLGSASSGRTTSASCCSSGSATGTRSTARSRSAIRRRIRENTHAAARARAHRRGHRHPADEERQNRRARRPRRRSRPRGEEPRGARQPRGPRAVQRPSRTGTHLTDARPR